MYLTEWLGQNKCSKNYSYYYSIYMGYSESEMSVNELCVKLLNYFHSQFPHYVGSKQMFFTLLPDSFCH